MSFPLSVRLFLIERKIYIYNIVLLFVLLLFNLLLLLLFVWLSLCCNLIIILICFYSFLISLCFYSKLTFSFCNFICLLFLLLFTIKFNYILNVFYGNHFLWQCD